MTTFLFPQTPPKGVQIPSGALDQWYTAKALAAGGSAQVNVVFIGDSWMSGYTSSAWRSKSWYALVKNGLTANIPLAGEYIPQADSAALSPAIPSDAAYWTITTAGTLNASGNKYLPFGASTSGATAATDTFVFDSGRNNASVTPISFVDCDVLYSQGTAGGSAFTVSIDGGANTNLSYNAGAASRRTTQQYTGLSNAPHTITITNTTAAAAALGGGVTVYPSGRTASGLVIARHCLQGTGSANISNQYNGGTTTLDGWAAAINDWPNTKLVIVDMLGNDMQSGLALDTYVQNMSVCLDWIKTVGASAVMMIPYPTTGLTNYQKFGQYVERITGMWLGAGHALVSFLHTFAAGSGTGWLSGIHPNDTGHQQIANTFLSFL